jgi:tetratricopeptide (TPR) repeat protein
MIVKSKVRYLILLMLINLISFFCSGNIFSKEANDNNESISVKAEEKEYENYKKAWIYFYQNKNEKAYQIVYEYKSLDRSKYKNWWSILTAAIYIERDQYQEVLDIIKKVRPEIEKEYMELLSNSSIFDDDKKQDVEFIYYKMLGTNGSANYYLKNWEHAIKDLLIYTQKHKSAIFYDILAISYYRIKNYQESLHYYKLSYKLHEDNEMKVTAAYNLGVLSAILGDVQQTIYWLKIPLNHNKNYWLDEIKNNEDFDTIKDNIDFKNFLKKETP